MGEALLFGGDFFLETEQFAYPIGGDLMIATVPANGKNRDSTRFTAQKNLVDTTSLKLVFVGDSITHWWNESSPPNFGP